MAAMSGAQIVSILGTAELAGLEIARAAKASLGLVYILLDRLEREGIVEGRWEPSSENDPARKGLRRRLYKLTGTGRRRLDGGE